MGTSGSTDVSRGDVERLFSRLGDPGTPATTAEVATRLDCSTTTARDCLERLTAAGDLQVRRPDDETEVWWQPTPGGEGMDGSAGREEFAEFVRAVEDYAILTLDPDGVVVSWNEGAERIKGYGADEIVGEHFSTFYTADAVEDGVPEADLETAATEGRHEADGWRVRADGSTFRANVVITAIRDDDGDLAGFTKVTRDVTERREYERELQRRLEESETRYRTLAEHFPNGAVGVYDLDLRYTLAAGAELGSTLPSADELEGSRLPDRFPPDTVADLEPLFRRAIEDGETDSTRTQFGGRHWHVWAAPLADDDGTTYGGLSFAQDVTEQVEREEHLRRFETIVEAVNDGVYVVDADGQFTMANDAYATMVGYDVDDLVGTHVSTVVDDAVSERAKELEADMDDDPSRQPTLEAELVRADGERFPAEASFALLPEGDDAWHRVGVVRDVTARRERERELELRARQQEAVAALGQFALESTDLDALMHEAAERVADVLDTDYCKVLDLDPEERELTLRQGVGWREGIVGEATVEADDDSQAGYTLLSEEAVVVEDLATETRFAGPDLLTDHDVTSGISTIVGSVDDPWGILGTHDTERRAFDREDVTFVRSVANVLAEAIERHRYQAELEDLVTALEESNERLEQFAYAASHDLQEPLRMVSSYLQLIERRYGDDLDEEGQEFLDFAVDGADRMREMIDGLLQYSRIDTRGDPFEPVDLDEVLEAVRRNLQVKIEEHDARIAAESLPVVRGDANQLRQLFQNLLDNAIDYSGDEPPEIEIGAERRRDGWQVSVRDEGIGIDPADADRVFEVFQRLHTRDEHGGTGIGLALCRRIVERHGGEIDVTSSPGDGSTFSFTLPAEGGQ